MSNAKSKAIERRKDVYKDMDRLGFFGDDYHPKDIAASSITHINGKPVSKSKHGYGIDSKTGKRVRFKHKPYA